MLSMATGADNKNYEMTCIPYNFVVSWLFAINPKNVKLETQEAVSRCHSPYCEVLFRRFKPRLFAGVFFLVNY
ncbi:hypothetical protein AHMF7605_26155 [Adhaeribacter arboris]|uniref:Antirepressor protein ant N-terminal domain-containing protein n=2 Tax=Adhaeribacter arboris TaxID=2072846 RepID=A0A2T2YMJ9_9BACT|nr:hypothetical protein AHMF7605_26155 [Adhaeribacter arboris]